jgi:FKBP-type peptidyl-prolyl cis-trans isomerase (trigger factor)
VPLTRQEIEKRMDELARKYVEKRDPEIIDELYNLRLELRGSMHQKLRPLRRGKRVLGDGKARR